MLAPRTRDRIRPEERHRAGTTLESETTIGSYSTLEGGVAEKPKHTARVTINGALC